MKKLLLATAAMVMLSTPAMADHVTINNDRKAQLIELVREAEHFCYGIQITKLDYTEILQKILQEKSTKTLQGLLGKEGFAKEITRRADRIADNIMKDNREFSEWCYQMMLDKVVANELIKAFGRQ